MVCKLLPTLVTLVVLVTFVHPLHLPTFRPIFTSNRPTRPNSFIPGLSLVTVGVANRIAPDKYTQMTRKSIHSPSARLQSILQVLVAIGIMIAIIAANGCTKALPEASKKLNTSKTQQQADRNYSPSRR